MTRLCLISLAVVSIVFAQFVTSDTVKEKCGENEELHGCANSCLATCERPDPRLCMINPLHCKEACKCKPGYVRETDDSSKCIAVEDCPKTSNQHSSIVDRLLPFSARPQGLPGSRLLKRLMSATPRNSTQ